MRHRCGVENAKTWRSPGGVGPGTQKGPRPAAQGPDRRRDAWGPDAGDATYADAPQADPS